ncbi:MULTISPECIES: hypothetical protein [Cryobacterium]|uniref:Uncharacterized protein n=1 Tax=Cryobacterium zongtaii TaxID=1259217 RepID=A0A2S3ZFU9_9MICO|nr:MULTISPECIES: hypothetical protein [Cryobacterium]POH64602.1 hypothetical protein C3B60_14340 [Cryobacterium zongtaii]POH65991.1 hypothetical protein C3B61_09505 [Cryobacterium zongtaii]TFC46313.1 hypothetical protein E3O57_07240 [Cryobacterium sp. TMN-39-2]
MNVNDASKTTAAHVDALIERIDPALIERIDKVTSESSGCRGNDVDPEQRVQQWTNQRYVWFVGSVSPLGGLDVLDELVASQVADGWTAGRETTEGDGRRVQLFASDAGNDAGYGVELAGGGENGGLTSLSISAVSPCFEVAEGERP